MIRLERIKTWSLLAVLTICGTASFASCSSNEDNGQHSVFILSTYTDIPIDGKVAEILDYAARIKVQESAP